jgi:hypothetical protein
MQVFKLQNVTSQLGVECTSIIPATQMTDVGGSQFYIITGKVRRLCLKSQTRSNKTQRWGHNSSGEVLSPASVRLEFNPQCQDYKNKNKPNRQKD